MHLTGEQALQVGRGRIGLRPHVCSTGAISVGVLSVGFCATKRACAAAAQLLWCSLHAAPPCCTVHNRLAKLHPPRLGMDAAGVDDSGNVFETPKDLWEFAVNAQWYTKVRNEP